MSTCITKDQFQLYNRESDFMIVMGDTSTKNNKVYRFKDFSHPGGWDYSLRQHAGHVDDK